MGMSTREGGVLCGLYEPRSSSAVSESRFTAGNLEEREAERFAVAEGTLCLGPFMVENGSGWPHCTCGEARSTLGMCRAGGFILGERHVPHR